MSWIYINQDWQYNSVHRYRLKANWMYFDRFAKVSLYRFSISLLSPFAFRQIHFCAMQKEVSEVLYIFIFSCLLTGSSPVVGGLVSATKRYMLNKHYGGYTHWNRIVIYSYRFILMYFVAFSYCISLWTKNITKLFAWHYSHALIIRPIIACLSR